MNFLKFIKQILLILLTFFLGAQTTYAKTEPVLPQYKLSFSIEQTQSFKSLEKELQPNIGFLKEKIKFVTVQSVSAQNQHKFSEYFVGKLAKAGSDWLVTLKSNTTFKSYLDNLIANPSTRKFASTLSVEEEAVLKFYTTNPGYKDFNKAIRGEIPMTNFYTAQKNLMEQALSKIPNSTHNGTNSLMYRIENLTNTQINSMYIEGSTITKNAFTSATHSENAIIDAIRSRPYSVMIRIEGKNGKLIEDLSTLPGEKEVLFTTGTQFEVTKVGFSPNPDDYMTPLKTVWLKEL